MKLNYLLLTFSVIITSAFLACTNSETVDRNPNDGVFNGGRAKPDSWVQKDSVVPPIDGDSVPINKKTLEGNKTGEYDPHNTKPDKH